MKKYRKFNTALESLSQHFSNQELKLTESPIHTYYGKKLGDPFYADGSMWHDPVDDMFYRINNIGLSGEDFHSGVKGLALGCSITAGCGLWHRWTWPYIVSHELGYSINSLGLPGRSFSDCVDKFFNYIKLFGKPDNVFVLTPDMFRLKSLEARYNESDELVLSFYNYSWLPEINNYVLGSDKPSIYKDVFGQKRSYPVELGLGSYLQSLSILCVMCDLLGINLKISSWDRSTVLLLQKAVSKDIFCSESHLNTLNILDDSIGSIQPHLEKLNSLDCHKSHPISQHKYWYISADKIHPGIHAHIHYAEMFLGKSVSKKTLDYINSPMPDGVDVVGGLK